MESLLIAVAIVVVAFVIGRFAIQLFSGSENADRVTSGDNRARNVPLNRTGKPPRQRSSKEKGKGKGKGKAKKKRASLGIDELARRLGVGVDELISLRPSYQSISIPKRRGGQRRLDVPDVETKRFQRLVLDRLLARLRSHPAAYGFERQRSIVDHAEVHVGQAAVLHMDLVDFFPSTRVQYVRNFFQRLGWDQQTTEILVNLTTRNDGLPQGAPTSPRLSNLVNSVLDRRMTGLAKKFGARYSRYADDITFSFTKRHPRRDPWTHQYRRSLKLKTRIRAVIACADNICSSRGYQLHRKEKLSISCASRRQSVTGLVVNEKVALPRETRRWLRAVKHRMKTQQPATITAEQLKGWLAFESMVRRETISPASLQEIQRWRQTSSSDAPNSTAKVSNAAEKTKVVADRSLEEMVFRIEESPRMSQARDDQIQSTVGQSCQAKLIIDREYQGIGIDASERLQGGVSLLARPDAPKPIVEIQFPPNHAKLGKSLRRGEWIDSTLRFMSWDEMFDRAVFEWID